jgi:hypothetical protein
VSGRRSAGYAATLAATLAYLLATLDILPRPYFYPHLARWSWEVLAGEPAIRWYGSLAYLVLGGIVGWLAGARLPESMPRRLAVVVPAGVLLLLAWMERRWF